MLFIGISPNNLDNIQKFILKHLFNINAKISLLVCGDFNLNLKKKRKPFFYISFMLKNFGLKLITNINESTKIQNSCINLLQEI